MLALNMRIITAFLLVVGWLFPGLSWAHVCLDEEGFEVDWYIIYKLPRLKDLLAPEDVIPGDLVHEGLAYAHFSSRNISNSWQLSNLSIGDPKSPPGRTLAHLYNGESYFYKVLLSTKFITFRTTVEVLQIFLLIRIKVVIYLKFIYTSA